MTYIATRCGYEDEDFKYLETDNKEEAEDYYTTLRLTYDENKHIYVELSKVYETEYRPTIETLRFYAGN